MTSPVKLGKVDQHIKSMMLTYPTLFKSRFAAMKQLFMSNGNGYEWDASGCLVPIFECAYLTAMDYSDLEERTAEIADELAKQPSDGMHTFYSCQKAALTRHLTERKLIEEEIDLYATEHVMGENEQFGIEWMKDFDPRWCAMRDAPFGALDPEWAAAAEEMIKIARTAIWRHLGMYHDDFDRELANEKWLGMYEKLGTILDKLDLTTGSKQRAAKRQEIASRLITGMLAKENDSSAA